MPSAPTRGRSKLQVTAFVLTAAAIAFVGLLELRQPFAHVRLVSSATTFLILTVWTTVAANRFKPVLLVLTSLGLDVTLVEGLAAWLEPRADLVVTEDYEIDRPILGWDNGPAGTYHARRGDPKTGAVIYDVSYTIDADHDRVTRSNPEGPAVAFFGESFTFGDGVADADTLPQRFADRLGGRQRVVNLAVSGFSPSQVLRQLELGLKEDVIGRDPRAFVMLTGSFHIVRTACRESWTIPAPRYDLREGELAYVGDCAEGLARIVRRFLESSAAYRMFIKPYRLRVTRRDVETYVEIVARTAATARERYGVDLLVPYVGGPVTAPKSLRDRQAKLLPIWAYLGGTGYDDEAILAALRKRGVKSVDVTLRDEAMAGRIIGIPGDGHPTPYANARRAELVESALLTQGVTLMD